LIKFYGLFVEVIIPLALPKNYTWAVPEQWQAGIQPGVRVEVIFGRNKRYAGIVKKILIEKPEAFQPKDISNVLDTEPLIHPHQLALWEWMSQYYMCSEGEVMQAAIPANLKLSSESILVWNEERSYDFSDLSDAEFLVAEALEIKKRTQAYRSAAVTGCIECIPGDQKTDRERRVLCVGGTEGKIQNKNRDLYHTRSCLPAGRKTGRSAE
jgi:primosomal protein N'